jgi:hypothetical protein
MSLNYSQGVAENIMFTAIVYNIESGERQTVNENSREALITTLETMLTFGWHVDQFLS